MYRALTEDDIVTITNWDDDPEQPIKAIDLVFDEDYFPDEYFRNNQPDSSRLLGWHEHVNLEELETPGKLEVADRLFELAMQVRDLTQKPVNVRLWGDRFTFYEDEQCPCVIKKFECNSELKPPKWLDPSLLIALAPFHQGESRFGTHLELTSFGIDFDSISVLPVLKSSPSFPKHFRAFTAPNGEYWDAELNQPHVFSEDNKDLREMDKEVPFLKCLIVFEDPKKEGSFVKTPFQVALIQKSAKLTAKRVIDTAIELFQIETNKTPVTTKS